MSTHDIDDETKLEYSLLSLFRSLAPNTTDPLQVVLWSFAFSTKLMNARYCITKCRELSEELPSILRKEEAEQKINLNETGNALFLAELYLESFLYFITSALDILAKPTRELYPKQKTAISSKYFSNIIDFFTKRDKIADPAFGLILTKHEPWITTVYNNRNVFAHEDKVFIGFDKDGSAMFEKRDPNVTQPFRVKSFEGVSGYLARTASDLHELLVSYLSHFQKRL
jgi:hypothetical protein